MPTEPIDPIATLRERCVEAGSQQAWAKSRGFSPAYISDVLSGRRDLSVSILAAIGLERVVTYVRTHEQQS